MKIYTLPTLPLKLTINHDITNYIINEPLFNKIKSKKSEIDTVKYKWDSAKKISNDYEYIYTSSNQYKNICSISPVSRSFFKLREIIYDFRLNIHSTISCIAEAPGGFIQSIIKHCNEKNVLINNIYGITLLSDNFHVPYWNNSIITHKNVSICKGVDNTGNIYKLDNVLNYIKFCGKHTCGFVTADGGFDYTTDFEQELSSYTLFYSEIMIALNIQSTKGIFICKLFDLFYYSTIQLVYILYLSYETVSFIKPLTSRQSNSEKYIICQGFKGYNKVVSNLLCSHFGEDYLPIKIPDEFIKLINNYHCKMIHYQINHIDGTIKLINQRRNLDKPSKQQVKLAINWCKSYGVPINKHCYYLK